MTGPSERAPIYGWRHQKESSHCSLGPSESKMNSFYEADFASVMVPSQSRQQRVAVKGELWHDSGTKKESTCTWLNADRSPAQLFLMVMHWQQGGLFLIACTSFRHTKQPPSLTSFVSNLHWPAFKAVSGSLAQKMLEESLSAAGCPVMGLKFPPRHSQISSLHIAPKKLNK